jgi:hypothetical protein
MNGEPQTIHVVAHPQSLGEDGYLNTDMQRYCYRSVYHERLTETIGNTTMKTAWVLWVGGIDDYYHTKQQAEEARKQWVADGYDDTQIE